MLCKFCKSNTIVVDGVDNRDTDETYRLRVCPRCGRSFYTVEFPVEVNDRFKRDWESHHKQHKKVLGNMYFSRDRIRQLLKDGYRRKANKVKQNKNKE